MRFKELKLYTQEKWKNNMLHPLELTSKVLITSKLNYVFTILDLKRKSLEKPNEQLDQLISHIEESHDYIHELWEEASKTLRDVMTHQKIIFDLKQEVKELKIQIESQEF